MKIKIMRLADPRVRKLIKDRFMDATDFRSREKEDQWTLVENGVLNRKSTLTNYEGDTSVQGIRDAMMNMGEDDGAVQDVTINYVMRNLRMLHSQMCANPPVVSAKPATTGTVDKRTAEAANHVLTYGMEVYDIQSQIELSTLSTLLYGTGYLMTTWDPAGGEFKGFDEETDEVEMEGDVRIYSPDVWNIWLDPKAERIQDVRYIIERVVLPCDVAESLFPKHFATLLEQSSPENQTGFGRAQRKRANAGKSEQEIVVYRYYEKGMPINAMQGRSCFLDNAGDVIGEIIQNPYQFKPISDKDDVKVQKRKTRQNSYVPSAILPIHILTDVDVPNQVYGKSFIDWSLESQDAMQRLDTMKMENVRAAGVIRLMVPEDANIDEDAITDSPYDLIKFSSNQYPSHISPPQLYGDVNNMRETLRQSIDELSGINDAMLGQVERETSGYAISFATNQANMIRRRLFNKFIKFTKSSYKFYLSLCIKYWEEEKEVSVLGPENVFDTKFLSGADIQGGYDVFCEYGNTFSLDPAQRRVEMMELKDVLIEGGMTPQEFVEMLAIGNTKTGVDMMQVGRKRQEEIFQVIIEDRIQVAPEEKQDHASYLAWAYKFVNTGEFRDLDEEQKGLVYQHIDMREKMAAEQKAPDPNAAAMGGGAPMGGAPVPPPQGGMPPIPMG